MDSNSSLLSEYDRKSYAAITLSGFDYQERNLTFVKTDFQVLKLKFLACSMKVSILFTNKILRELGNKKVLFYKLFVRYLVVKPVCINAA